MVPRCPECRNQTVVRKIEQDAYRCTNCGCGWTGLEQAKYYGKFDYEPPADNQTTGLFTPTGWRIWDNLQVAYENKWSLDHGTNWRNYRDSSDPGPDRSAGLSTGYGTRKDGTLTDGAKQATSSGMMLFNPAYARDKVIELYGHYPLPMRQEPFPITAWKAADPVKVWKENEFTWDFDFYAWEGIGVNYRYRSNDVAVCNRHTWEAPGIYSTYNHDAPDVNCHCGFWAYNKTHAEYNLSTRFAILEVDLYGKVLVGEFGYRAEKQKVIAVHVLASTLAHPPHEGFYECLKGIVEQDGLELIIHDSLDTIPFQGKNTIDGTVE